MKSTTLPIKCDDCGQDIISLDQGMVEWIDDYKTISEVRIVHNPAFSPQGSCYKHTREYHRNDLHLSQVTSSLDLMKKLGLF